METNSSTKIYLQFISYFVVFSLFIAALSSLTNYSFEKERQQQEILNIANQTASIKRIELKRSLHSVEQHLAALTSNPIFKTYIKNPNQQNLQAARNLFLSSAVANINYFQVRYINVDGMEEFVLRSREMPNSLY
jgi:methionyl-tRNA formyltransferase